MVVVLTHVDLLTPAMEWSPPYDWVGGTLSFGDGDDAAAIAVTLRDLRCSMITLDPDSAASAPAVLKAVARANRCNAGIYGTVTRTGRLAVGQTLYLRAARR